MILQSKRTALATLLLIGTLLIIGYGRRVHIVQADERETINLGSVQVYLGESKAETLAALVTARYVVTPFASDDTSFIITNNKSLVGTIAFQPVLTFVNKDWNPKSDSSGLAFAKAIFYASQSLNDQGCTSVLLTAGSNDQPAGQIRNVVLHCVGTHRRFEISAYDLTSASSVGQQATASLQEILQTPKP
jgi:hypothetical protein